MKLLLVLFLSIFSVLTTVAQDLNLLKTNRKEIYKDLVSLQYDLDTLTNNDSKSRNIFIHFTEDYNDSILVFLNGKVIANRKILTGQSTGFASGIRLSKLKLKKSYFISFLLINQEGKIKSIADFPIDTRYSFIQVYYKAENQEREPVWMIMYSNQKPFYE